MPYPSKNTLYKNTPIFWPFQTLFLLLKLTFKVKYNNIVFFSFFHTFWSEGNHQLFCHKMPHKADKIMQFCSDFGALLDESHFYPPNSMSLFVAKIGNKLQNMVHVGESFVTFVFQMVDPK